MSKNTLVIQGQGYYNNHTDFAFFRRQKLLAPVLCGVSRSGRAKCKVAVVEFLSFFLALSFAHDESGSGRAKCKEKLP
ncbi:MAG: hypothetical protein WC732_07515 [Candidatus Omnitrophota bacterium]